MAPTNDSTNHRVSIQSGLAQNRLNRNANTNAGVNQNRTAVTRGSTRGRDTYRQGFRNERLSQALASDLPQASSQSRPADRITSSNDQGLGLTRDGVTLRPCLRPFQRLQDRITETATDHDTGVFEATPRQQIYSRAEGQNFRINPTPNSNPNSPLAKLPDNNNSRFQSSTLFVSPEPGLTQSTESSPPFAPTGSPPRIRTAVSAQPIRMLNQPIAEKKPKRPVKTFRGKDPIKKRVQNKKLQAIFSDKPIPKARKKAPDERPVLRMGGNTILK
ncbi:hypothetical protein GQ44DRAFT_756163 [Phaeosphaeriaceae sp. PMI808]|nr:hypothetical protein GQ44DRAFT_756163 [Phaeosphaeriaceae sp. PMI808]